MDRPFALFLSWPIDFSIVQLDSSSFWMVLFRWLLWPTPVPDRELRPVIRQKIKRYFNDHVSISNAHHLS